MTGNPLFSYPLIADFYRTGDPDLCCDSVWVENTTAGEVTLQRQPYPCKAGSGAGIVEVMTKLESDTEANIVGFLVSASSAAETLAATTGRSKMKYALLTRGPAVVSKEGYAKTDLAGTAYDAAKFDSWCATVANPIIVTKANAGLSQGPIGTQANPNF